MSSEPAEAEVRATASEGRPRPAASGPVALRVEDLGKRYRLGRTVGFYRYRSLREDVASGLRRRLRRERDEHRELWALRHVGFEVHEGETVGVIGHNGAGKSTLFKVLSKITPPTEGRAEVRGRLGSLLEVGTGFHPELTGRENVFLSGAVLGMRRAEIARKLDEIVDFAGVAGALDTPVKRYSSGMYLRLAFAVAAHLEPEILLVDEVLSVGDTHFQRKCLGKMAEVGASGRTVLFVSHSMPAVLRLCPRVVLLDHGRVVADGPASEVVRVYLDSGGGTAAVREWEDPELAPGDEVARLRAVRVRDGTGRVTEEIDICRPMSIEVEYVDLGASPDQPLTANVHLFNGDGVYLFASADFNAPGWRSRPRRPGVVRSTCTIPGNFLAEGRVFVMAAVSSLNPPTVHAQERDAVAFQVVDRSAGEGVRGEYASDWPGVVRPLLDWTVERLEDEPSAVLAEGRPGGER
jgi:lipopolysaccharide transport system ATP-binding protein